MCPLNCIINLILHNTLNQMFYGFYNFLFLFIILVIVGNRSLTKKVTLTLPDQAINYSNYCFISISRLMARKIKNISYNFIRRSH